MTSELGVGSPLIERKISFSRISHEHVFPTRVPGPWPVLPTTPSADNQIICSRLLVNFIPRWLIILVILGLYVRLYFIIHRAHKRFESFEDDDAFGSLQSDPTSIQLAQPLPIKISSPYADVEPAAGSRPAERRRTPPALKRACMNVT